MKKFTLSFLFFLALGLHVLGQYTAVLPAKTASPNENVQFNLNVTGFNNIASIQFYIQFNSSVLTFQSVTNFSQPGLMTNVINGNTLTIIWTNVTPKNFPNGTLLNINFKYHGLNSPVAFIPSNCEVVQFIGGQLIPLVGTFTDGSISPFMGNVAKAKIDTVLNASLGPVTVPIKYSGFGNNVGSITQKIAFDPTKLTFAGVTGTGNLATGLISSVSAGIITITWSNAAGKNINYPGSMFNILFDYTNSSPANVTFSTGCIIETSAPAINIPVSYFNGLVAPVPIITSYASIGNVTGAIQGQQIDVPVTFSGMPGNTSNFNLSISFDSPRLSFIGVFNALQPVISNVNANVISITNANPITPAPSINGQFMVLRFVYNGIGNASINFGSGCQFSNGLPIGVGYTNGSISPAVVSGNNSTIAYVTGVSGSSTSVPVSFNNMPTNIGAITMFILYDAAKLTYTGALNPYGATVKNNGNLISVVWTSTTPTNFNGINFVTLNFNYLSGSGSNCSAPVTFTDGSQIANTSAVIIPTNWNNGGVNVKFKVSGTVKYNSDPNPRLPLSGYKVKIYNNPSNEIVDSVLTSAEGYYEFILPNGNYRTKIEPPQNIYWYSDLFDVLTLYDYINFGTPIPYQNDLRLKACDINQNEELELFDVLILYDRINFVDKPSDYLIDDFVFDDQEISIECSEINNVDILGLFSGNVLGTATP